MISKLTGTIILFSLIGLASLLSILWLIDFSQLGIPEKIPVLKYRPYGILILTSFIIIFIFFQKRLLKIGAATSAWQLVWPSIVVSFISFFVYQAIRQLIILRGQYDYDKLSVLLTTVISTIASAGLAATVAMELKKVKAVWKWVPAIILLILLLLTKQHLEKFEW